MSFALRRRGRGLLFALGLLGVFLLYYRPSLEPADWTSSILNDWTHETHDSPATEAINVVLAHVGEAEPPKYLSDCIQQIRACNPTKDNTHIWIIIEDGEILLSKLHINHLEQPYLHLVNPNDLDVDLGSGKWNENGIGFWAMTTQRILYIESLIRRENMRNVFMIESDNLLYMHLRHALPAFQLNYPGVGATRDSPVRAIAGLTWFSGPAAVSHFAQFIRQRVTESTNDMLLLAEYIATYESDPSIVSTFPVVPPWDEQASRPMRDGRGNEINDSEEISTYTRNFDALGESIFDAAALGQYMLGIDHPRGQWTTGFVNPDAVYEVTGWTYTWQMETYQGVSSWTPFIVRNPTEPRELWQVHRINNLHVHHKNLGYQRALPEGPDVPAHSLAFHPTEESGAQRGPWVERWNDQTNEFRSRIAEEPLMNRNLPLAASNRPWSYPLISGDDLRLIADYGRDEDDAAYFSRLDTASFKPGTVVMVPSSHLRVFFSRPAPTVPYILISGYGDTGPTPDMAAQFEGNSSLRLWLAQNPTFTHPRLLPLPIAFMNREYTEAALDRLLSEAQLAHGPVGPSAKGVPLDAASPSADRPQSQRDILLYVNLGDSKPDKSWIAAIVAWATDRPDVLIVQGRHTFEQYMSAMRHSQYVLIPPGNGMNSHRAWETLLMGAVPIVQHSPMDNVFVDHPVLLVNGPEDVTPELLEQWEPSSWTRHNMWSNTWYDRIVRAKQECVLEWNAKR